MEFATHKEPPPCASVNPQCPSVLNKHPAKHHKPLCEPCAFFAPFVSIALNRRGTRRARIAALKK